MGRGVGVGEGGGASLLRRIRDSAEFHHFGFRCLRRLCDSTELDHLVFVVVKAS